MVAVQLIVDFLMEVVEVELVVAVVWKYLPLVVVQLLVLAYLK